MAEFFLLLFGGLVAGTLGGMPGIGGGIVLMPMLRFIIAISPVRAIGICIIAVFFTTLGGSYRHYKLGHLRIRPIVPVVISGVISTVIFSMVFIYFSAPPRNQWLDLAIGIVFSLISIRMIAEGMLGFLKKGKKKNEPSEIKGTLTQKSAIGALAGALPGLLGIGTGVILVPTFNLILAAPIKTAMASSLMCFSFNAFISSTFKFAQGFIDLRIALPICLGTLIGANLGAMLNKRFPSTTIKTVFGLVFLYISAKFILFFFGVQI